jgi:hypothetical protein
MSTATELLRDLLGYFPHDSDPHVRISAFLAAEPEAEPLAWVAFNLESNCYMWSYIYFDSKDRDLGWGSKYELRPIYSHPPRPEPARKPMTEDEIKELCPFTRQEFVTGFNSGVRFAEKHHGITE